MNNTCLKIEGNCKNKFILITSLHYMHKHVLMYNVSCTQSTCFLMSHCLRSKSELLPGQNIIIGEVIDSLDFNSTFRYTVFNSKCSTCTF